MIALSSRTSDYVRFDAFRDLLCSKLSWHGMVPFKCNAALNFAHLSMLNTLRSAAVHGCSKNNMYTLRDKSLKS